MTRAETESKLEDYFENVRQKKLVNETRYPVAGIIKIVKDKIDGIGNYLLKTGEDENNIKKLKKLLKLLQWLQRGE